MSEPRQTFKVNVPIHWDSQLRRAFAKEVVRVIRERTEQGIDKDGRKFKGYSDTYANSKDFKIAGKNKANVNLRLTSEMMNTLDVVSDTTGVVHIGYNPGTDENDKAAWAAASDNGVSRKFLGISDAEAKRLIEKFDTPGTQSLAEMLLDRKMASMTQKKTVKAAVKVIKEETDLLVEPDLFEDFRE